MHSANTPVFQSATLPPLSRIMVIVLNRYAAWNARARSRKELGRLDAHLLRDIGIDPMTAHHQASRPFWRR